MAYGNIIKNYEVWESRVRHHGIGSMPFCVAFCGVFSSGKSSLLNALLGCGNVLPTGINPVTKIVTRIRYGRNISLHCIVNGDIISVPKTQMKDVITGKKELPEGCTELIVDVPAKILKNHVEFIDTPGYEDDTALEDMSRAAVMTADYVVFCCNATMLGKEFEKQYLQELEQTHGNFCMIVNRMDCVNTKEDFEDVKKTACRLMAGRGMAAHPEETQGNYFLTIGDGVYATLNGFEKHMEGIINDYQERQNIRHSTNQRFTEYYKKQFLSQIKKEASVCRVKLKKLRQEDVLRREKLDIKQRHFLLSVERKTEKAMLFARLLVSQKREKIDNQINKLTNVSLFEADAKSVVRIQMSELIKELSEYSKNNGLMPGGEVRNALNKFSSCWIPKPTFTLVQRRGLLGRALQTVKDSVELGMILIDDGTDVVYNDFRGAAVEHVDKHLDKVLKAWSDMLQNWYTLCVQNAAEPFSPTPEISELEIYIHQLNDLQELIDEQVKLINVLEKNMPFEERLCYVFEQAEQFECRIANIRNTDRVVKNLKKGRKMVSNGNAELLLPEHFQYMCQVYGTLSTKCPEQSHELFLARKKLENISLLIYERELTENFRLKIANGEMSTFRGHIK